LCFLRVFKFFLAPVHSNISIESRPLRSPVARPLVFFILVSKPQFRGGGVFRFSYASRYSNQPCFAVVCRSPIVSVSTLFLDYRFAFAIVLFPLWSGLTPTTTPTRFSGLYDHGKDRVLCPKPLDNWVHFLIMHAPKLPGRSWPNVGGYLPHPVIL